MADRPRAIGLRIAVASWLAIAALTLMPHPEDVAEAAATPLTCLLCGQFATVDVLLNILLFLPLGLGLVLAGFSPRRAVLLCGITTLLIELLQMKVIPGRDASLSDLVSNTLGGAAGASLAAHWRWIVFPTADQARRLALGWAVGMVAVWAGTAWALGLALPQDGRWFGGWAPEFDNFQQFLGKPLLVRAGGEPLLPGPALDQHRLEDALNAQPSMSISALLAAPPRGLAPIGVIVDAAHDEVLLLGQDGEDLVFRMRMRAAILRLRAPQAVLAGGFRGGPGDTADATASLTDSRFELRSAVNGRTASRSIPLDPAWGWMLVSPIEARLDRLAELGTGVWIAGLFGVLTFWAAMADGKAIAVIAGTALVLFAGVPLAAGFPLPGIPDWLAALAGTLLGVGLSRPAIRHRIPHELEDVT